MLIFSTCGRSNRLEVARKIYTTRFTILQSSNLPVSTLIIHRNAPKSLETLKFVFVRETFPCSAYAVHSLAVLICKLKTARCFHLTVVLRNGTDASLVNGRNPAAGFQLRFPHAFQAAHITASYYSPERLFYRSISTLDACCLHLRRCI